MDMWITEMNIESVPNRSMDSIEIIDTRTFVDSNEYLDAHCMDPQTVIVNILTGSYYSVVEALIVCRPIAS